MEKKKVLYKLENINIKTLDNKVIFFKGNLGVILKKYMGDDIIFGNNKLVLKSKINYKLFISLLDQIFLGVKRGYFMELEFVGLGYRFINLKTGLFLKLGLSHYIKLNISHIVKVIGYKNRLVIFGLSLEEVNNISGAIRNLKKPEIYKGKGIHYLGEKIRLKIGKQK